MNEQVDPKFNEMVWKLVRRIPAGKVLSYGRVAQLLGVPQGARAVGWAMHAVGTVPAAKDVPWHRVVNSQGRISISFSQKAAYEQRARLEAEGVRFDPAEDLKIAGFKATLWQPTALEVRHLLDDDAVTDAGHDAPEDSQH